jgi:uncharacterized damage-inducible protein DinB
LQRIPALRIRPKAYERKARLSEPMKTLALLFKTNSSADCYTCMTTIGKKLQASLNNVLAHDPWYGPATYDIIDNVSFEAAYEKPPGCVHSIAVILLHMLGWTQEVSARMGGQTAGEPAGGDWPNLGTPDEHKWKQLVADFKLANVNLERIIADFPPDNWNVPTNDERNGELGTGVSYEALIKGLIQHHIYHSGQIALLNRIVGG